MNKVKKGKNNIIPISDIPEIFERLTDAFIALDQEWSFTYLNKKAAEIIGVSPENILGKNIWEIFSWGQDHDFYIKCKLAMELQQIRESEGYFSLFKLWYHAVMYPSPQGISICIENITEKKLYEKKLLDAKRLYAFISQINQTIVHAPAEEKMFSEICSVSIAAGGFKAAWIGLKNDNGSISLITKCGVEDAAEEAFTQATYDKSTVQDHVILTGEKYICNNMAQDKHCNNLAVKFGLGSCITLPVYRSGKVTGTFNLYTAEKYFFNRDEILLLEEATNDISFALDVFDRDKERAAAIQKLKDNELRLKQTQAIAHLGSWELDFNTGIAIWSEEALRIYGLPENEKEQSYERWISFIHPEDVNRVIQINKSNESELSNIAYFHRIIRVDGTIRHVYSQAHFKFNENGKPCGLYGVVHDVTDIKEAEEKVKKINNNLRLIIDLIPQSIFAKTYDGKFIFANKYFSELYGYKNEDLINRSFEMIQPLKNEYNFLSAQDKEVIDSGETRRFPEMKVILRGGEERIFNTTKVPFVSADTNERAVLGIALDVTERRKLEQQIVAMKVEEQKKIAKAIVSAQEKERAEIGYELHDNINQILAATSLYLNYSLSQPKDDRELIMKGRDHVLSAMKELRKLSHALVGPSVSNNFSLTNSVEEVAADIAHLKNIRVNFRHEEFKESQTEGALKLALYRIIREQLSNILKHADATQIDIDLKRENDLLKLVIEDNGKGFDPYAKRDGIGLNNIENRADIYNGSVEIISAPGKGCKIILIFRIKD